MTPIREVTTVIPHIDEFGVRRERRSFEYANSEAMTFNRILLNALRRCDSCNSEL